jgi:hypothetical protein
LTGKDHNEDGLVLPDDCKRSNVWNDHCFVDLGKKYKFYMSHENGDCEDYITEKLFRNAFLSGMVPIVCSDDEVQSTSVLIY